MAKKPSARNLLDEDTQTSLFADTHPKAATHRPGPINTAIDLSTFNALSAKSTASRGWYSSSLNTGSSVQLTPDTVTSSITAYTPGSVSSAFKPRNDNWVVLNGDPPKYGGALVDATKATGASSSEYDRRAQVPTPASKSAFMPLLSLADHKHATGHGTYNIDQPQSTPSISPASHYPSVGHKPIGPYGNTTYDPDGFPASKVSPSNYYPASSNLAPMFNKLTAHAQTPIAGIGLGVRRTDFPGSTVAGAETYDISNGSTTSVPTTDPATRLPTQEPKEHGEVGMPFSRIFPDIASSKPPVFDEKHHHDEFTAQLHNGKFSWVEGFPGAMQIIKGLNPRSFEFSWDSRVVCIKTDYYQNIHWSAKRDRWVTMDKVGERINNLWYERETANDSLLLLFSINGQKCYCGLAMMRGPWKIGGVLDEWMEDGAESKHMGTIPITWCYMKNVPYEYFSDIHHVINDEQPIVNMWNGMHFPAEKGVEVVGRFIEQTHFTNALVWRKDKQYSPYKDVTHAAVLNPGVRTGPNDMTLIKNNIKARQIAKEAALESKSVTESQEVSSATAPSATNPSASVRSGCATGPMNNDVTPTPKRFGEPMVEGMRDLDGAYDVHKASVPRPGEIIPCVVDKYGNYVPVAANLSPIGGLRPSSANVARIHSSPSSGFQRLAFGCEDEQHTFSNAFLSGKDVHGGIAPPMYRYETGIARPHNERPADLFTDEHMYCADYRTGVPFGQLQPHARPAASTVGEEHRAGANRRDITITPNNFARFGRTGLDLAATAKHYGPYVNYQTGFGTDLSNIPLSHANLDKATASPGDADHRWNVADWVTDVRSDGSSFTRMRANVDDLVNSEDGADYGEEGSEFGGVFVR